MTLGSHTLCRRLLYDKIARSNVVKSVPVRAECNLNSTLLFVETRHKTSIHSLLRAREKGAWRFSGTFVRKFIPLAVHAVKEQS